MINIKKIIAEAVREALHAKTSTKSLKEQVKKSTSWGEIPSEEELEELMDGEEFDMNLQGEDSLAWDYAMALSSNLAAGGTGTAEQLRASLEALVNAPSPAELSDEQYEEVEDTLDLWNADFGAATNSSLEWGEQYQRHGDYSGDMNIEEAAWNLASGIMAVLGVEWI